MVPTWRNKPAGKHPQLRPKASTPLLEPEIPKRPRTTKRGSSASPYRPTKQTPSQPPTRRIITRSQTKIFRLMDLPPELRNLIHQARAATHSDEAPLDLVTLTIPPDLSLSKQVRAEALPAFFAANHFKLRVGSNYCVWRRHFHHAEHVRYLNTGTAVISPKLLGGDVADEVIRFKHVTIEADCVCCTPGKQIAKIELFVLRGGRPAVDCAMTFTPKEGDKVTGPSLEKVFKKVREVVDGIGKREGFNGFKVADVIEVAGCLCYEEGAAWGKGGQHEH